MTEPQPTQVIEIGLPELLLAIARRKKLVLWFVLIAAALSCIISFILPRKWTSQALITPIADNTTYMMMNTNFASLTNMPIISTPKLDMAIDLMTIMDSRTFREDMVRKFRLIRYFRIDKPDSAIAMDLALIRFNENIFFTGLEQQSNTIKIKVTTKDKYLSRDIADYSIKSLERYITSQKKVKSRITREFLEKHTSEIQAKIDSLLIHKRRFQTTGKAYAITEQTKQALDLYSGLVSDKLFTEIELAIAKEQVGFDHPKVHELEARQKQLQIKISAFELNKDDKIPDYILKLSQIPDANLQFNKIQLDLDIMNKVYEYLYPMLESARITELKEMPSIEIMDKPSLAGLKAYPKRTALVMALTLAAFLLACFICLADEFMTPEDRLMLKNVLSEFRSNKKSPGAG